MRHTEGANIRTEYSDDFRRLVFENMGALRTFKELETKLLDHVASGQAAGGLSEEAEGIRVTLINQQGREDGDNGMGQYMKVDLDDTESFFVKRIPGYFENYGSYGAGEFYSMERAKQDLEGIPGVRVVDFQLGYQDIDRDISYFVSKWVDGEPLPERLDNLMRIEHAGLEQGHSAESVVAAKEEREDLTRRFAQISDALSSHFSDVKKHNVMYEQATGDLVVFDVHLKSGLSAQ